MRPFRWPSSSSSHGGAQPPPELVKQALRPPKWYKPATRRPKPKIRLWREYLATYAAHVACERSHAGTRERLVARWGEARGYISAKAHWGHDPEYPALARFCEESDRLNNLALDTWQAFLGCPSVTIADAMLKLSAVAEYWRTDPERDEQGAHHEVMGRAVFGEMQTFILPLLPPELSPVGMV